MPKLHLAELSAYENVDSIVGNQEYACVGDGCEIAYTNSGNGKELD